MERIALEHSQFGQVERIPRSEGGAEWFILAGAVGMLAIGLAWLAFSPETDHRAIIAALEPPETTAKVAQEVAAIEEVVQRSAAAPALADTLPTDRQLAVSPEDGANEATIARGTVRVESDLLGLTVYLGREKLGTTPLERRLPAGTHTLRIVDKGRFLDERIKVEVRANRTTTAEAYFGMGKLKVDAEDGTKLWINGRFIGEAPFGALPIAEGTHSIKLALGDSTIMEKLEIPAGRTVAYRLDLR